MTPDSVQIRRVTDPNDPAIAAFGTLQDRIYFEPEMLIPARYIVHLLQDNGGARQNVLLLAEEHAPDGKPGRLLGGTLFHFLPEAGTGFSSFLGVDPSARGRGVARRLHTARWQALQEVSGGQDGAGRDGAGQCRALFIDVVNPARESADQREQERMAGSDATARRQTFHALGFRTVDLAYEQPVGGEDGGPVTDMDLLAYVPGLPESIPAALVGATMQAYWTPWLGQAQAEKAALKLQAGQREVALLPAWEGPAARS
ncbi:GNAT family N-acetyltransferase [Deinococcus altitudinis]|uniref:GNAT family N-acetyltransferase n=1 Tax=Deinococcus altitudinis TaxID=468914 RepID=UPI00389221E5